MAVDGAELIGLHLAEIGGLAAEGGNAGGGVAGRAAGDFDGLAHVGIERFGARLVDQVHRALDQPMPADEAVLDPRDHVDDGIADAQDVDTWLVMKFSAVNAGLALAEARLHWQGWRLR